MAAHAAAFLRDIAQALDMAAEQAGRTDADPARRKWLAVFLLVALQGACVCALMASPAAEPGDVFEPGGTKLISPGRLLRRVQSPDYLGSAHRLSLTAGEEKALKSLIVARNAALHIGVEGEVDGIEDGVRAALKTLRRLLVEAPAFDIVLMRREAATARVSLDALERALAD